MSGPAPEGSCTGEMGTGPNQLRDWIPAAGYMANELPYEAVPRRAA